METYRLWSRAIGVKFMDEIFGKAVFDFAYGKKYKVFQEFEGSQEIEITDHISKLLNKKFSNVVSKILDDVPGPVLEVGCGAGAHLIHLKEKRKIPVFGLETSDYIIRYLRRLGIPCLRAEKAREEFFERKINTVLMLNYGFGIFGNLAEQKKFLSFLSKITTPNAKIFCSEKFDEIPIFDEVRQLKFRFKTKEMEGKWIQKFIFSPPGVVNFLKDTDWHLIGEIPDSGNICYVIGKKK